MKYNFLDLCFVKFNHKIIRPCINLFVKHNHNMKEQKNKELKYGLNTEIKKNTEITISLTSYPERFSTIDKTLISLLNQTLKPDRILLYLGNDTNCIPESLKKFEKFGVKIIKKEENIMPHKKYFYAMQEFPNDIIITVDDDCIYQSTLIEKLIKTYKKYPSCVCANRVHYITKKINGEIHSYNNWINNYIFSKKPSHRLFATGMGGVLYPPHILPHIAFDIEKITKYCLKADDIWLKFMELLNNVKVVWSPTKYVEPLSIESFTKQHFSALHDENVALFQNDKYIKELEKLFKLKINNFLI